MEPLIRVKNMSIVYNKGKENEFRGSDNINLDIYRDEYIILFGPSGCGKSTLLYAILGILAPTSGHVIIDGEDIYAYDANQMVKYQTEKIGIMYQAFYLIPSLTIADNVSLPQIFQGIPPAQRRARAIELCKRFGIEKQVDKLPEALSGGQMQRVSVARALVNDPDIILADEPVGNLDSISARAVMDTLMEINVKDKKTIILVTHDAAYLPYAHRVIYLKDGKVVRIVPNPEREQIAKVDKQKTLVTEIEQLTKIYPYLSPPELKVKSIINYLTQDITIEQLERLEYYSKLMLERRISRDNFYQVISKDFDMGGVGLGHKRAAVMAERIEKIIKQAEDVRRYRRRLEDGQFFSNERGLINNILMDILEDIKKKLTHESREALREAIRDRLCGLIKKEEFMKKLNTPQKQGGVGLNKRVTFEATRYMEKILTQGIEIKAGGH